MHTLEESVGSNFGTFGCKKKG
ncbi:hypothetical protein Goari_027215 [Gossypium aridum]|uniref:Uncharacterized protein n=1 Tax=Gossypium aridum TaxID=34290 RepID=A0A7J8YP06_GOSAI|nr:hypothetical protein [Gossypium aridum]